MNNLLRAELYKLRGSRSFWCLTACSVFLGTVMNLDRDWGRSASGLLLASMYHIPLLYFLIIIFAALFLGEEFGSRTLNFYIGSGHRRSMVLFTKTAVYLFACVLILAAPLTANFLIGLIVYGNAGPVSAPGLLLRGALLLAALAAMGMLPLGVAFLSRDMGKTLVIPLALYFLMIFLLNGDYAGTAAQALPIGHVRLLSQNQGAEHYAGLLAVDAVWITACYGAAWLAFRRCDLK